MDPERYLVISADCHGGGNIYDYRPYLASRWHDQFDAWAATYEIPYEDLKGPNGDRNWDSKRRLRELEGDGIVAEVIFPNTVPPFFPKASLGDQPPRPTPATSRPGGPACRRTTVGWPISAPRCPAGARGSPRSCCTTSTPRSARSIGPRRTV
jgi:hypothetical protein